MKWKNLIKVAFKNIKKNRMRSFLTMLGIIIGVGAVIGLVAIGQGTSAEVQSQIASLGSNLISVMRGSGSFRGVSRGASSFNTLTMSDVEQLRKEAKQLKEVSPLIFVSDQVIFREKNWLTSIQGVDSNYLKIREWDIEDGTFFSERDLRARKKVAVLGKTVAKELFDNQNPIGSRVRIRNIPFTVIGTLKEKGQSMRDDQDDVILAPSTTILYRMTDGKNIHMIYASAVSGEAMDVASEEITRILRKEHRLKAGAEDDFHLHSQTEIIERVSSVTGSMTILLGAIAAVSLLVGGIGIMNIMLVSVTERTREIGIRMAIGARSGDVLVQFLIEAVLLSLVGGFLGIVFGIILAKGASSLLNMRVVLDPVITFVAFFFSGAVGIFFGFYPARKASRMNPIEALRYE